MAATTAQNAEWNRRGKERSPEQTVDTIQKILESKGFSTSYQECDGTFADCYSARLDVTSVPDSLIGTNGKGVGPEYCKASAYAELMERLENHIFNAMPVVTDSVVRELYDCNPKPVYQVKGENQPECILRLKQQIAQTIQQCPPWMTPEELVDEMLEQCGYDALDLGFAMDPYYSLRENKIVNLPTALLQRFAVSNGMAAGNTLEEAIVQAMSEIFERYATIKFVECEYRPPIIPNSYCQRYPRIYRIIQKIEESGRYQVILRDCSMGMKLPVVCGAVVDRERQRFGLKFGSHPNMEVALERIFTEAMQGSTLEAFAGNSDPVFSAAETSRVNTFNLIKVGKGDYPISSLLSDSDYPFVPWEEPTMDNRLAARQMLSLAESLGGDVYLSNRSFLGFPAVFIYISGLSEVQPVDMLYLKEMLLTKKCVRHFRDLQSLSDQNVRELYLYTTMKQGALVENTIGNLSGRYVNPASFRAPQTAAFFRTLCLVRLGRTQEACKAFQSMSQALRASQPEHAAFAKGAWLYLAALLAGKNPQQIAETLRVLCPAELAENILDLFADMDTMLDKCYPLCRGRECGCCDNAVCSYPQIIELYKKLAVLEAQNPPDQTCFMDLLK